MNTHTNYPRLATRASLRRDYEYKYDYYPDNTDYEKGGAQHRYFMRNRDLIRIGCFVAVLVVCALWLTGSL